MKLRVKQRKANKNFKAAVVFTKAVLADPKKRKAYEKKLKPGKSVCHTALSEFLQKDKA